MQHETDFAYDAGDRLTTIRYPTSPATTTSFGYDVRGRRTLVTDQNGKVTTYAYDDADRLTSVTDAAQHVTSYAYDDENNLLSITDANNHMTSFAYDNFGRVKETDFPSGKAETYTYDEIGNLLERRIGTLFLHRFLSPNFPSRVFATNTAMVCPAIPKSTEVLR